MAERNEEQEQEKYTGEYKPRGDAAPNPEGDAESLTHTLGQNIRTGQQRGSSIIPEQGGSSQPSGEQHVEQPLDTTGTGDTSTGQQGGEQTGGEGSQTGEGEQNQNQ